MSVKPDEYGQRLLQILEGAGKFELAQNIYRLEDEVSKLRTSLEAAQTEMERARHVVVAAQELKRVWRTAGQGNTDEAMDTLFDLLPVHPTPGHEGGKHGD